MSKRDQIQSEALALAINYKKCGLGISMGVGKTLIGLQYIAHFQSNPTKILNVLLVAPKLSVQNTWQDEAVKFGIPMDNVQFTTYLSLNKMNPHHFDLVILDECHSLLYSHKIFLENYQGRILGLTGTPPRYLKSEKGQMVATYCPMVFKYITDDAVDDGILNDYKIIVHKLSLSTAATQPIKTKNGEFYSSEQKSYDYWTNRLVNAKTKKEEQIASVMRMRVMMEFKTKEHYTKQLLESIEEKCIVFCNTQVQADSMCEHAVHSNHENAEENLQKFKEGVIEKLSCVLQLNEGINIPHLKAGIIMHAYGNERKSSQRIGRLLRLNPEETALVHILCYKDTVDERWVNEALKDLDPTKISYFDVNVKENESSLYG